MTDGPRTDGTVLGEDGLRRCRWGAAPEEYRRYHDQEWGRPVGDDRRVLEKLCLEGFQSGLSWLTILRKREAFRRAFSSFDPEAVSRFGPTDVERLLADPGIVRHRGKILATIANAEATLRLHESGRSLAGLVWHHAPDEAAAPVSAADLASETSQSRELSPELRRLGFRFVGPTTVHSAMQALGLVNDHLQDCAFRAAAGEERRRFAVPEA